MLPFASDEKGDWQMTGTDAAGLAVAVAGMARDKEFARIEDLFAPPLRAVVSAQTLCMAWEAELTRAGRVTGFGEPATEPGVAGLTRVRVPVDCERGGLTLIMSVDSAGLLQGLRLEGAGLAAWTPPPYAAPGRFREREVTVGAGLLAVPGTMTLPRGNRRRPGVVLLSGGGPFDRDETSGPNKPLKDLAWGLASRGIAVLRYDKMTYCRPETAAADGMTMRDEYVPHGVEAVRLLARQRVVDPARVFALGHSMGGKVAPLIATAEPSVAGLVIMAGDAQPMHAAAVRVARYLAAVNPGPSAQAAVAAITEQAGRVDRPDLSPATPAADLPFGLPASYWLHLRDYDPVATAAAAGKPMLILQGGRDYQVTVEDDLALWRAGLEDKSAVNVRVYASDNHLFFPGTGTSTPADYDAPQHVDPVVVADIAGWLTARPKRTRRTR
jgi:uncharacterized protein